MSEQPSKPEEHFCEDDLCIRTNKRLSGIGDQVFYSNRDDRVKVRFRRILRFATQGSLDINSNFRASWHGAPLEPSYPGTSKWLVIAGQDENDALRLRAGVINANDFVDSSALSEPENFAVDDPGRGDELFTKLRPLNPQYELDGMIVLVAGFYDQYVLRGTSESMRIITVNVTNDYL